MYLLISTVFSILPHTTVHLENNHATVGGAINVHDVNSFGYCALIARYLPREECSFQLPRQNLSKGLNVQLIFKNNSVDDAGSMSCGGKIDYCKLTGLDSHSPSEVFDMLLNNNDTAYNTTSKTSSDPLYICQERMMTSFLLRREEEERVTSYSGRGESRISRVYYK